MIEFLSLTLDRTVDGLTRFVERVTDRPKDLAVHTLERAIERPACRGEGPVNCSSSVRQASARRVTNRLENLTVDLAEGSTDAR